MKRQKCDDILTMITPQSNTIGWVEVPAVDMERAMKFYETVFDVKLERHQFGPLDMAWFPSLPEAKGSAASLVKHEMYTPSTNGGVLVYFTAHSGDLKNEVSRVEAAGGTIRNPIKKISDEYGYMAVVVDTEGNCIAIHSRTSSA